MSPYYFSVFHQNKERHLLRQITGRPGEYARKDAATLRVGLFTDTLDDVNGVARFIRDIQAQTFAFWRSGSAATGAKVSR